MTKKQHAERDRWHSEEIHCRNRFPMVSKEGKPALGPVRISRCSFHPTGDGSFGKIKTEHAEFPMYLRRSPGWVLGNHSEDQIPNLLRCPFPSNLPPDSGNLPPVDTKASPVPADDSFRCDDEESLFPFRPEASNNNLSSLCQRSRSACCFFVISHDR